MRNDFQDLKAILDRQGIAYEVSDDDIPGGGDIRTLKLQGPHGIYFRFLSDDSGTLAWKHTEYGVTNLKENK